MNFFLTFLGEFDEVTKPLEDAMKIIMPILWTVIGAVGVVLAVFLGLGLARAEDATQRAEAKKKIMWAIIGYFTAFILVLTLQIINPLLIEWTTNYR